MTSEAMATVERYHAALEARKYDDIVDTMTDDVQLHSPITGRTPIRGKRDLRLVTGIVLDAIDDLTSTVHPLGADTVVVLFSGSVRGVPIQGVDVLRLAEDGRIADVTVYIRPLLGLITLMSAVGGDVARANGRPWVARLAALTAPVRGMIWAADRFVVPQALRRRRT